MHPILFTIGNINIPSYGFLIALGGLLGNVLAFFALRSRKREFDSFLLIEAYGILGAFIGSKLLWFIVSADQVDWSRFFEPEYFNLLMQAGFVFYGGLILAAINIILCGKLHKIDVLGYLRDIVFVIPFGHAFGRIGCFMAGCCYGMHYNGPLAVIFPEGSNGPVGVSLFPVQLLEALLLFLLSAFLFILRYKIKSLRSLEAYIIGYGIIRFILEFLRGDEVRGIYFGLSTSQWIAILMIVGGIISLLLSHRHQKCVNRTRPN